MRLIAVTKFETGFLVDMLILRLALCLLYMGVDRGGQGGVFPLDFYR